MDHQSMKKEERYQHVKKQSKHWWKKKPKGRRQIKSKQKSKISIAAKYSFVNLYAKLQTAHVVAARICLFIKKEFKKEGAFKTWPGWWRRCYRQLVAAAATAQAVLDSTRTKHESKKREAQWYKYMLHPSMKSIRSVSRRQKNPEETWIFKKNLERRN